MRESTVAMLLVGLLLLAGCSNNQGGGTTTTTPATNGTGSTTPTTSTPTPAPALPGGTFRVHYVNVGQGDATVWEFPDGTVLVYGCGPRFSSPATNPVTLFLRDVLGRPFGFTLWVLLASHGHLDHVGGCEEVFSSYQVEHVYEVWYQGTDRPTRYHNVKNQVVAEGALLRTLLENPLLPSAVRFHQWDTLPLPPTANVTVQIMWPPAWLSGGWDRIAYHSIVLRATYGSVDYCFQGDIETSQESTLASYARDLDCEVYLIGHHGSHYASGTTWLSKMDPEHAVASFGTNPYQHGRPEALCRAQTAGGSVYATHRLGTITVATDGATVTVSPDTAEVQDHCKPGANYWTGGATPTTTAPTPTGSIQITTVLYDPPGPDSGGNLEKEWVEITDQGGSGTDLTGWTLRDAVNATFTFPHAFNLGGGASVKVRAGTGTNTATDLYWNRGSAVWNNDHDTATLRDADGQTVDVDAW
jgi:competence protein ComEC